MVNAPLVHSLHASSSLDPLLVCRPQEVEDEDEGHLRKVFNSFDLNGDGEITIDELQQVIRRTYRVSELPFIPEQSCCSLFSAGNGGFDDSI